VAEAASGHGYVRQQVDRSVLVLFASVIESLGWATAALLDQDVETADRVIDDDRKIDEQCNQLTAIIKNHLLEGVAPDELDELVTLLQMVPELERSADLAEHIARRAKYDLGGNISPRCRGLIQSMCDVAISLWQLSSRAYAERYRGDLTFEITDADDELDNLSADLRREGVIGGVEPAVAAELALVARFYERLGDHAVNLARRSAAIVVPRGMSPLRA
jgi:phosphate transport system protein